jgi:hypothetical protein
MDAVRAVYLPANAAYMVMWNESRLAGPMPKEEAENYMQNLEDETCDEPKPENMRVYNSRIAGNLVAQCMTCGQLWGYWDCAHDFAHDCES